jgi:hypothetical protein
MPEKEPYGTRYFRDYPAALRKYLRHLQYIAVSSQPMKKIQQWINEQIEYRRQWNALTREEARSRNKAMENVKFIGQ